jgi:hypothetical protein
MYNFTEDRVRKNLDSLFHEEAIIHLSHPFGDIEKRKKREGLKKKKKKKKIINICLGG